ncbi:DUF192 domain-containing protein [Trichocoleus sp. FACHB-46]|uniref:DUF192 domain-containing protein n=1 Tax=Trichocoleus desertorum GB2-A4 TaxID=2933944 RepID=A0ABV0J609_9CYAN|nr:DUF192 domain-containing protein [Trichocoleus sp. FACHB-46]
MFFEKRKTNELKLCMGLPHLTILQLERTTFPSHEFPREYSAVKLGSQLIFIGLSSLLLACAAPSSTVAPTSQAQRQPTIQPTVGQVKQNMGQQLPIAAQTKIKGQVIQLEVAQTRQQQAMGLMYRTALAANRGMLFPFNPPRSVGFWMKNTLIPLDMVFLRNGEVKAIRAQVPPCKADPCPSYGPGPNIIIDQVIELRGGRAAQLGLKVGDRINLQFLPAYAHPTTQS